MSTLITVLDEHYNPIANTIVECVDLAQSRSAAGQILSTATTDKQGIATFASLPAAGVQYGFRVRARRSSGRYGSAAQSGLVRFMLPPTLPTGVQIFMAGALYADATDAWSTFGNAGDQFTDGPSVSSAGFMAYVSGDTGIGVWVSTNKGVSWTYREATEPTIVTYAMGALAITSDGVLFVVSGQHTNEIWRSTDQGVSWSLAYTLPDVDGNFVAIANIEAHPTDPNRVTAVAAHASTALPPLLFQRAVCATTIDQGTTWSYETVLLGSTAAGAFNFIFVGDCRVCWLGTTNTVFVGIGGRKNGFGAWALLYGATDGISFSALLTEALDGGGGGGGGFAGYDEVFSGTSTAMVSMFTLGTYRNVIFHTEDGVTVTRLDVDATITLDIVSMIVIGGVTYAVVTDNHLYKDWVAVARLIFLGDPDKLVLVQ